MGGEKKKKVSIREARKKGKRSVLTRLVCLTDALWNCASFLLSESIEQNNFLKLHKMCQIVKQK